MTRMALMRTGRVTAEAMAAGVAAAESWIATEIPRLGDALAAWEASVPVQPTQAQADELYLAWFRIVGAYQDSWRLYVLNAHPAFFNNTDANDAAGIDAANAMKSAFATAIESAKAPYLPLVNDILRPLRLGLSLTELEARQTQGQADMAAAGAAWNQWLAGSSPHFSALTAVYQQARANPYGSDVDALASLAVDHRDALRALAHTALGGAPVVVGFSGTLARALESVDLAFQETDAQLRSNRKVRELAEQAAREGYEIDLDGTVYPSGSRPGARFSAGPAVAILGGALALFWWIRRRKRRTT